LRAKRSFALALFYRPISKQQRGVSPYLQHFHDGRFETLADVNNHYNTVFKTEINQAGEEGSNRLFEIHPFSGEQRP
jgi:hypothetical protein